MYQVQVFKKKNDADEVKYIHFGAIQMRDNVKTLRLVFTASIYHLLL